MDMKDKGSTAGAVPKHSEQPHPPATREALLNRLASIAVTAVQAQTLTDLETLGQHLDDLECDLNDAKHLAEVLEWPVSS